MIKINWDEYKEFKKYSNKDDKFVILLDFIKSYYNMHNPSDIYDVLISDELASMMLQKRDIVDAEALENYIFKM
jgi:hypothetical protein